MTTATDTTTSPEDLWGIALYEAANRVALNRAHLAEVASQVALVVERIDERLEDGNGLYKPNDLGELQSTGPRLDAIGASLATAVEAWRSIRTLYAAVGPELSDAGRAIVESECKRADLSF